MQNDFPTAAEIKGLHDHMVTYLGLDILTYLLLDRADKAAATTAAQRRSLDAFRGVHLDPKAQHWDEVNFDRPFSSRV